MRGEDDLAHQFFLVLYRGIDGEEGLTPEHWGHPIGTDVKTIGLVGMRTPTARHDHELHRSFAPDTGRTDLSDGTRSRIDRDGDKFFRLVLRSGRDVNTDRLVIGIATRRGTFQDRSHVAACKPGAFPEVPAITFSGELAQFQEN